MTEDEMVGWHHRLNGQEFEQALEIGDGQGSLVFYSPWGRGVRHDWVTELNWIGMLWYFVLICNSLIKYNVKHFSYVYLLFIYLLWCDVCSDHSLMFKLGCLFSYCSVLRVLHIFWIWVLYQFILQIFLLVCDISFFKKLFIFSLCWVFIIAWTFLQLWYTGFSLQLLLL